MVIKEKFISKNLYSLKAPRTMTPKGICIHNTYNKASANNEISYMTTNKSSTSYHTAIDEKEVIQAIPYNRTTNACGDRYGNDNYIQIEICHSTGDMEKFRQAEKNTVKYIVSLMLDYGFTINNIKTHQFFSGKKCPHKTLELGWNRFIDMVKDEYVKQKRNQPFLVRVTCETLNVRQEPSTATNVVSKVHKGDVYTIIDTDKNWGKLKSGVGWISLNYTERVK